MRAKEKKIEQLEWEKKFYTFCVGKSKRGRPGQNNKREIKGCKNPT